MVFHYSVYKNSGGIPAYSTVKGFYIGIEFNKNTFVESLNSLQSNILEYENKMHEYPYDSELMNKQYIESMTQLVDENRTNYQYKDMKSNKILYKLSKLMKL